MSNATRLLDDTQAVVFSNPPSGHVQEYPTAAALILRMYSRCRSLFAAAAILVKAGHGEEALILGRSLFADALRLMDLAKTSDRNALILGWAFESQADERRMVEAGSRLGVDDDPTPLLAAIDRQVHKLEGLQRRLAVTRTRRFATEEALARRHDRTRDFWTFEFGHRMTHGTMVSHESRTRRVGEDVLGLFVRNEDPQYLEGSASFLVKAMIDAQRAVSRIFAWTEPPELDDLWTRAETMAQTDTGEA